MEKAETTNEAASVIREVFDDLHAAKKDYWFWKLLAYIINCANKGWDKEKIKREIAHHEAM